MREDTGAKYKKKNLCLSDNNVILFRIRRGRFLKYILDDDDDGGGSGGDDLHVSISLSLSEHKEDHFRCPSRPERFRYLIYIQQQQQQQKKKRKERKSQRSKSDALNIVVFLFSFLPPSRFDVHTH